MFTDNFSSAEELIDTLFPLRKASQTHGGCGEKKSSKKANGKFETLQENGCLK